MRKILVVCAHPDDETLGLGGTIAAHAKNGDKVYVLILTEGVSGRGKTNFVKRENQARRACSILGTQDPQFLNYPDQKLDTIPLIELSRHIEHEISKWGPETVYSHYWGDANQDHKKTFEATLVAVRPKPSFSVKRFICFETPSSTEWGNVGFHPNLFVDIEDTQKIKMKALQKYKDEVRGFPHPRSRTALISRARYWGSTVGIKHAEAFLLLRELIKK